MRFGHSTRSLPRTNPPPSKWFVAAGPVWRRTHSAPTFGLFCHLAPGISETGSFEPYWM